MVFVTENSGLPRQMLSWSVVIVVYQNSFHCTMYFVFQMQCQYLEFHLMKNNLTTYTSLYRVAICVVGCRHQHLYLVSLIPIKYSTVWKQPIKYSTVCKTAVLVISDQKELNDHPRIHLKTVCFTQFNLVPADSIYTITNCVLCGINISSVPYVPCGQWKILLMMVI